MGYHTDYTIVASPVTEEVYEKIDKVLRTFNGYVESNGVDNGVGEWMDNLGSRVEAALAGVGSAEQIAEGVREGMYEVTARQNDLLREQNELLQRLLNKNTTVQIGNKTIKDAVVTQENADGYRFTK